MEAVLEYDIAKVQETCEKPVRKPPTSVEEYLAMPEGAPYFQFINGEAVYFPTQTLHHQSIILDVLIPMNAFVSANNLGKVLLSPLDLYLNDRELYMPDLMFASNERLHILTKKNVQGAPDLVVEVLSPSTGYYDLSHKKMVYEREGVREYWLVYPDELRIEVLQNTDNGFIVLNQARKQGVVSSAVLEGFSLDITEIFE
jgi:Uma2 family endonuclease